MLDSPKQENWFFYFLLCVYGYERLSHSWRVTRAVPTALLSMAMQKGDTSGETAYEIMQNLGHHDYNDIRAIFLVDLDLARSDPESATVEKQAGEFASNAQIQPFTSLYDHGENTNVEEET